MLRPLAERQAWLAAMAPQMHTREAQESYREFAFGAPDVSAFRSFTEWEDAMKKWKRRLPANLKRYLGVEGSVKARNSDE